MALGTLGAGQAESPPVPYRRIASPDSLMRQVAQLSPAADGPRQAITYQAKLGIAVVILPHLPRTHLDGAVMNSAEVSPVIGPPLRYDRLDNFWYVLLHELTHATRHL